MKQVHIKQESKQPGQRTIAEIISSTKHLPSSAALTNSNVFWKDREVLQEYALLTRESTLFKKFNPGDGKMVRDAYREVILKLCSNLPERYNYFEDLSEIAKKSGTTADQVVKLALSQLRAGTLKLDSLGRVENAKEIGNEFSQVYEFLFKNVDMFFIFDKEQLSDRKFYLPQKYRDAIGEMVDEKDVAAVIIAKEMPERAKQEVRELCHDLGGTFWLNNGFLDKVKMSSHLRSYLKLGTVRVLCTKDRTTESNAIARSINEGMEEKHGFQDHCLSRLMDYLIQNEKSESLKDALKLGFVVGVVVKLIDLVAPKWLHVIAGVIDDIVFGILPDVFQSIVRGVGTKWEQLKKAGSVFFGGAVGLPASFLFGWVSTLLYHQGAPLAERMLAGFCFAIACGIGTVGTSIAAVIREFKAIKKFYAENGLEGSTKIYLKKAFQDSILRVPFRIGHTIIGLPAQIAFGMAAGAFNFFHHWVFVSVEGMLETILGIAVAFSFSHYATRNHRNAMRKHKASDLPEIKAMEPKQSHTWPTE